MTSFLYILLFLNLVASMSKELQQLIRTTFELMANLSTTQYPDTFQQENLYGASVANIDHKSYFFDRKRNTFTLAIAAKENKTGKTLGRGMIRDVRQYYRKNGFKDAAQLLEYSLWTYFVRNVPDEAEVAAVYSTFNGTHIQIISTGMLWAGLFRKGKIISSISPTCHRPLTYLLYLEYLRDLDDDGKFDTTPYTQNWHAQEGDIMVVTRADLPPKFIDIVQLAVNTAGENCAPVSRIVSNLRAYYNIGNPDQGLFAAVQVI